MCCIMCHMSRTANKIHIRVFHQYPTYLPQPLCAALCAIWQGQPTKYTSGFFTSTLPTYLPQPLRAALCAIWQGQPTKYTSGFFTSTLPTYLSLYVLHYVPYVKDSQQNTHQGFSPVPYLSTSAFMCCIMCHMARTANKIHIRVFHQYPTYLPTSAFTCCIMCHMARTANKIHIRVFHQYPTYLPQPLRAALCAICQGQPTKYTSGFFTSTLPIYLSLYVLHYVPYGKDSQQNTHQGFSPVPYLPTYLSLYVLHYVPYGKDSQQNTHQGFSPVPYLPTSAFTCCIMCHMARTANKIHIRIFHQYPTYLPQPLRAALCAIWQGQPTKYTSGFFTSTLPIYLSLYVLHYVPYGKDSQQNTHQGFSPVPYLPTSAFTCCIMCHMARTANKIHIRVFHQYPTYLPQPLRAALCAIWQGQPTKYTSGFFTSTLPIYLSLYVLHYVPYGKDSQQNTHQGFSPVPYLPTYLSLYVLHYVPYGKDSQQNTHQGFSPVPYLSTSAFTCCIMCHMARTANKIHIRVFHQYPTYLPQPLCAALCAIWQGQPTKYTSGFFTSTLPTYLSLYVLHYVPYGKDSQQNTHQGFSPVPYLSTSAFTCCIMCHMARTANKIHIRVFHQYPTYLPQPLCAALCAIWQGQPTKYTSGFFTSTLPTYLSLYVLHYVPYGKDSQQNTHQGFSPVPYLSTSAFTCCIMCHMARTANKIPYL